MADQVKMKTVLGVFIGLLCTQCVLCLTEAQILQTGKLIRRSCKTKSKSEDDELDGFRKGKFDSPTENAKCYLNCALVMMKLVKKDGHIDYDSAVKQAPQLPEPRRGPALASLEVCKNAGDDLTHKCEIALAIANCMYNDDPEHYLIP